MLATLALAGTAAPFFLKTTDAFLRDQGCAAAEEKAHLCVGNINQLVLKLESYAEALERSKGIIAEFVNPKYKDSTKTEFKSATRLECMMQDFPKALPSSAAIGFTVINQVQSTAPLPHCFQPRNAVAGTKTAVRWWLL